ncbi:alpha/beta hydrolase [Pelomyxa schiedti]|nr:alpha/beta hydrolase [Pelomyxa schiedti]
MGQSFVRSVAFVPPPSSYSGELPNVWLDKRRGGGRVPALFIGSDDHLNDRVTVLYTHGNAEDMGMLHDWMTSIAPRLEVNILIYDYTGYGLNGGAPTEENCTEDITTCYQYLTVHKNIPSKNIVLMGRSLGSGPTVGLAHTLCTSAHPELHTPKGQFGGMVIQSGIASCVRVVSTALSYVPFTDMFCNLSKMNKISVPSFIIHGKKDEVVPFEHGCMLFNKLSDKARFNFLQLDNAGHNDIEMRYEEDLIAELKKFFIHVLERANHP